MTRILFVDDEPQVLDGIRISLRKRRAEWELDFVDSGAAALAAMELKSYDLICSDMRMPGMDGAQLLTAVSDRWPETVRIVLSGYAELAQTIRLVPIAHQYLSKPCKAEQFDNTIARCINVQQLLGQPTLRAIVGRVKQLPALPRTYDRLRVAMTRPNTTVNEIAAIVGEDMAITAKVLQVANSAFFRLARKVTKVEQAVSHLGFAAVRNLVMCVEVFSQWNRTSDIPGMDLEQSQSKALKTGAVARAIAKSTPFADDALITGLLLDVGYLILINECPDELRRAAKLAEAQQIPMWEAERATIGASHAEVGAYLLALWGLPYSVVEAVAHHHEPNRVAHTEFDLLATATIANAAVDAATNANHRDHSIDDAYLKRVHAPFNWESVVELAKKLADPGATET